mmetsp:Transcript_24388/g.62188  ORF Transcript_24388/g.62188 Transcript_24388/m.62188 type:complete len:104 (-) Transcript_24388:320-631(-)
MSTGWIALASDRKLFDHAENSPMPKPSALAKEVQREAKALVDAPFTPGSMGNVANKKSHVFVVPRMEKAKVLSQFVSEVYWRFVMVFSNFSPKMAELATTKVP